MKKHFFGKRTLVTSIFSTVKSLAWALLLLVLIVYLDEITWRQLTGKRVDSIQEEVLCFGCNHVLLADVCVYTWKWKHILEDALVVDYVRKKSKNNPPVWKSTCSHISCGHVAIAHLHSFDGVYCKKKKAISCRFLMVTPKSLIITMQYGRDRCCDVTSESWISVVFPVFWASQPRHFYKWAIS